LNITLGATTCLFFVAHSALTYEDMALAIKTAYTGVKHVEILQKFVNFSESVQKLLNNASRTKGIFFKFLLLITVCVIPTLVYISLLGFRHFQDYRSFKFYMKQHIRPEDGSIVSVGVSFLQYILV
jgi:hypothetical protein